MTESRRVTALCHGGREQTRCGGAGDEERVTRETFDSREGAR